MISKFEMDWPHWIMKYIFLIQLNKLIDASIVIKEELNVPYIPKSFNEFLNDIKE